VTVKHRAAEATVEGVQQQAGAAGFVMAHPMSRLRAAPGRARRHSGHAVGHRFQGPRGHGMSSTEGSRSGRGGRLTAVFLGLVAATPFLIQ